MIVILGSDGMLGRAFGNLYGSSAVCLTRADCDFTNFTRLKRILNSIECSVLINCAAIVDMVYAESFEREAYDVNTLLPFNLARYCNKRGCKFVQISTDHYYIGNLKQHCETSPVTLVNKYAMQKFTAEHLVLNSFRESLVVRTSILGYKNLDGKTFMEWVLKTLKEKNHPDLLKVINDLASLRLRQKRYEEAETLLRQVLAGNECQLGLKNPRTLNTVNSLAMAMKGLHRFVEAEHFARRALEGNIEQLGNDDPRTMNATNMLAQMLIAQKKYTEAVPLLHLVLNNNSKRHGTHHKFTMFSRFSLASILMKMDNVTEAEPLLRIIVQENEKKEGSLGGKTLNSINTLAIALLKRGCVADLNEAKGLFLQLKDVNYIYVKTMAREEEKSGANKFEITIPRERLLTDEEMKEERREQKIRRTRR